MSSSNFNASGAAFPDPAPDGRSLHQGGADPNSPQLFAHNMQLVQEHVARIVVLTRRTQAEMYVWISDLW